MKNKNLKRLSVFAAIFCLVPTLAWAMETSDVSVPSGQNIETDYINAGNTVDVGSDVKGDVILAGGTVSYSGNATGDILLLGGNARVKGDSAADVRVVGGNVTLDGTAAKNVTVAGGSVIIEENGVVEGNLYVAGGTVELRGQVKGNVVIFASQVVFAGKIDGNADFKSNKVTIRDDARIGGNLSYSSSTDAAIKEGVVSGSVTKTPIPEYLSETQKSDQRGDAGMIIWGFLSLFIVWIAFDKLFRKQLRALVVPITQEEVWNRIAYGLIAFILNAFIIFIVFASLIGMPLAFMILFSYIVFIIAALALMPVLIGRMVNARFKLYPQEEKNLWIDFVFGYVLMQLIGFIPVIGWIILIFLFLLAFGRVTKYFYSAIRDNR